MPEFLMKLKKDGKTVGYLHIIGGIVIAGCEEWLERWGDYWRSWGKRQIDFDTAHPFVTKDKNGKDVFADDKVKAVIPDVSNSPLIGRIIPNKNPLSCWMFKYRFEGKEYLAPAPDLQDIELIEEKEHE